MADVKWIKLSIDMFSNRKIRYLRSLPEGNNIILIWVMLLTIAGKCNASGMIFLTENVSYTTKMLAEELGFNENIIIVALNALEQLGMINRYDESLVITGWEEHQNVDGLEKLKEQNRARQEKFRQKQQFLLGSNVTNNVTDNVTVTLSNGTDIDKDIDIDKDKDKKKKHKYGSFEHILLSNDELSKLKSEYGDITTDRCITYLDEYIEMKGSKYKNHYLVIKKWVVDAVKEKERKGGYRNEQTRPDARPDKQLTRAEEDELLRQSGYDPNNL